MIKKIILYIALFIIILFAAFSIFNAYARSNESYNPITGEITCYSPSVCWHELAHALDMKGVLGWVFSSRRISQQDDFISNVDSFILYCEGIQLLQIEIPYCNFITSTKYKLSIKHTWLLGGWGGYSEIYADILRCSGGIVDRIPESLQQSYDQSAIDKLSVKYELEYIDNNSCEIRR